MRNEHVAGGSDLKQALVDKLCTVRHIIYTLLLNGVVSIFSSHVCVCVCVGERQGI